MISSLALYRIFNGLEALCDNNSDCGFCPLKCICTVDFYIYRIGQKDIDELVELVREHE